MHASAFQVGFTRHEQLVFDGVVHANELLEVDDGAKVEDDAVVSAPMVLGVMAVVVVDMAAVAW